MFKINFTDQALSYLNDRGLLPEIINIFTYISEKSRSECNKMLQEVEYELTEVGKVRDEYLGILVGSKCVVIFTYNKYEFIIKCVDDI